MDKTIHSYGRADTIIDSILIDIQSLQKKRGLAGPIWLIILTLRRSIKMTVPIIQDHLPLAKEIAIFWYVQDIQIVRPDLTEEQGCIVLHHLKKAHDPNRGINWETIELVAGLLFPAKDDMARGRPK